MDDFRLGDINASDISENYNQIMIGKKNVNKGESKLVVKFSNLKKGKSEGSQNYEDSTNEFISYIQETSEYVCTYPYVFYCKGNKELFI